MKQPQANNRILRWALKLSSYKFDVIYRPGKRNQVADSFSRMYEEESDDRNEKKTKKMKQTKRSLP